MQQIFLLYYKKKMQFNTSFINGANGGIRTRDLLITNQLLCQLSHTSRCFTAYILYNKIELLSRLSFRKKRNEGRESEKIPNLAQKLYISVDFFIFTFYNNTEYLYNQEEKEAILWK